MWFCVSAEMLSQQGVIETPMLGLCFPCLLLLWQWCLSDALVSWLRGNLEYFVVFCVCLAPESQGGQQCSSQGRGSVDGGGLLVVALLGCS